jgi:very-short-patch-repair endonuclease
MLDRDVMALAARQHGVLGIRQLRGDLGITTQAISRARRRGLLVDVASGVVRVASSPDTLRSRCMALQLTTQGAGCVSGWTAAHLYGLRAMPIGRVHYTIPASRHPNVPPWAHRHRCTWFVPSRDTVVERDGLVVATPMRMLFGLAADFNQLRFERAAEDAWHRQLVTPPEAAEFLELHRCRGKNGVRRFERWLKSSLIQDAPSQSNLERRLLTSIERLGLPRPTRQFPLVIPSGERIHLDIAWPDVRLAVEPGASWWHGGDAGQRRDQTRDRGCAEVGWAVVRFDEEMRLDVDAAARQVGRIHRARTAQLRSVSEFSR